MDWPKFMRRELAQNAGIYLDERPAKIAPPAPPLQTAEYVDRDAVRVILIELGAPARDLEWLVASCPSLEHALAFEPTPWMLRDFTDYLGNERPTTAGKGRP